MTAHSITSLAIRVEHLAAALYLCFYHYYEEDTDFWWQMVLEEKNHASILTFAKTMNTDTIQFPDIFSQLCESGFINTIQHMNQTIDDFKTEPFDRVKAFNVALELERNIYEQEFQNMLHTVTDNEVIHILQKLKIETKSHAEMILSYMEKKEIPILEGAHIIQQFP